MRIIDSNTDYYDFYQNVYKDDMFTFDRRDSYNVSKKEFAGCFSDRSNGWYNDSIKFIVIQIGSTFWLIKLIVTEKNSWDTCTDYSIELLSTWKDYSKSLELMKITEVKFFYSIVKANDTEKFINAIKTNDVKEKQILNDFILWKGNNKEERHIPILKDTGIPAIIPSLDIYLAFEEYFSRKKTESEMTEPIGMTNDDKIVEHGFDTVTSFRG